MSRIRPKQPRLRLDPESYKQLCLEVLQRDGWRCQSCGGRENLQIHHKEFRSRCGDDSERNLITLCADCHNSLHQGRE
jgi:5-methylcytosine-specific restriction endonuclease McrA